MALPFVAALASAVPALAAQPVTPASGALAVSAMPTFRWTADHPGQYSTFLLTGSPQIDGSEGRMSAESIDSNTNVNGETGYTPLDPIDAGRAWWQVCERAPDYSTACSVPREVLIPIALDDIHRTYSPRTRAVRVSLSGNLWRGGTASVKLAELGWSRTFRQDIDSGGVDIDSARIPRRVHLVSVTVRVSIQGVTKKFALPRVRSK